MLTQKSTTGDIQKFALRMVMKQQDTFNEQDIIDLVISQFEDEVDEQKIEKIVAKIMDYCRREIRLIDFADGGYVVNQERKELVDAFLNHEGVTL